MRDFNEGNSFTGNRVGPDKSVGPTLKLTRNRISRVFDQTNKVTLCIITFSLSNEMKQKSCVLRKNQVMFDF